MQTTPTSVIAAHVPAAALGDREAFSRLVDGTRSVVASIALAIVRDPELSRDVAQDVFLAAWRDLGQLRDAQSFLPWLRQATRHRAYHVLRTERRQARRVTRAETDEILSEAVDVRPGAEARLLADEDRRVVTAVLDALPDETREVVTLYYREGQSSAQVAQLLGMSDAAVRKRLSRARATLRASLLDRFGDAARATAPGAMFTTAVMTAVTVGAPSSAAAAAAVSGPFATGVTGSIGAAKIGTALAAVVLPAAGGLAGVFFGTRQLKRQARSADELDGLRRFELASAAVVVAAAAAFPATAVLTTSPWAPIAVFVAFIASLALLHARWLPRIVAPRHALEFAEDPVAATQRRTRERRTAVIGWTAGILSGSAGLLAGLLLR